MSWNGINPQDYLAELYQELNNILDRRKEVSKLPKLIELMTHKIIHAQLSENTHNCLTIGSQEISTERSGRTAYHTSVPISLSTLLKKQT